MSVDSNDINKHKFEYRIGVKEDANDYLRYVRVVDAIPKKETSFYRPSLYWYALTSPKKDNTKLWLNYNSDLRSPILTTIEFDVNLTTSFSLSCHKIFPYGPSDLKSELKTVYDREHSSVKSNSCYSAQFYICDINEDVVRLIALNVKEYHSFLDSLNEEFKLKTHTEIIKKYYSKSLDSLGCNVFSNKKSFEIPVTDFYTNGFLKNSVWFNFLEDKYLYEKKVFVQDKTTLSVAK